ncbi:MAG TPA: DMT family transporter [Ktedonobacterales bacterium]|nr:DMT family transporter [Ktedonobacterales bacterium]
MASAPEPTISPTTVLPPPAKRSRRWLGALLIVISAATFGTLAIFARLAYAAGANPTTALLLRFAVAGGVLLVVMVVLRRPLPRGRLLLSLILMGGVGYVGQSLAYFTALTFASAALVALLLYLYPALVTLLAALFLKERLTRVKLLAVAVALAGTVLTIGRAAGGSPVGIALALAGSLTYAVYIVAGSRVMARAEALSASTVIILAAAAVYAPVVALQGPAWPRTPGGWLAVGGMALVATVIAIVTFFAGLKLVGPSTAATLSTVEPVVTVTLAAVVLGEQVTPLQLAGGVLILSAVVVLARGGS